MAGASDKARFYLEQFVPELQELERKKIFTKEEVSSIAKKRSDFEHKLNARGSRPSDYARYIEYEMNLESLRRKRAKRMGIKSAGHSGQKRIYFILDRATRKFHGDVGLWMQYLDYAKRQKSHKKVAQIFTSVLRLHPTKPELWIMAAQYSIDDQGDMIVARNYMQRGLRFCKRSKQLWLQYAKLELNYVAKITARQKILGLDSDSQIGAPIADTQGDDTDHIALPAITAEDMDSDAHNEDDASQGILKDLSSTPALSGAIPIAIFDAAMEIFHEVSFAEQFFDLAANYNSLTCSRDVTKHILEAMYFLDKTNPASISCHIRQPLIGIPCSSPEFPATLSPVLKQLRKTFEVEPSLSLFIKILEWLLPYLAREDIDPDIQMAIKASLDRLIHQHEKSFKAQAENGSSGDDAELRNSLPKLPEMLQPVKFESLTSKIRNLLLSMGPADEQGHLLAL